MNEPILTITLIDLILFISNTIAIGLYLHEKSHHDRTQMVIEGLEDLGIIENEED